MTKEEMMSCPICCNSNRPDGSVSGGKLLNPDFTDCCNFYQEVTETIQAMWGGSKRGVFMDFNRCETGALEKWISLSKMLGLFGDKDNVDKKCTKNHHFYLWRDPKVSPIGICACQRERLDRIEAVWQKYKHLNTALSDPKIIEDYGIRSHIMYDLWQAIRREK